jgi:predicted transcriptional regulator
MFVRHRYNQVYVVNGHKQLIGVVSLHNIQDHLHDPSLAALVTAHDIMEKPQQLLHSEMTFAEVMQSFLLHNREHLPVVKSDETFLGSISKTDLLLLLSPKLVG